VSSKRTSVLKLIVERLLVQRHGQEGAQHKETKLLFTLLKSLSMSAEIAKEIMKIKAIDDLQT